MVHINRIILIVFILLKTVKHKKMRRYYYSILICLSQLSNVFAQESLHLQYYKHIKNKSVTGIFNFPRAYVNDQGWMFLHTSTEDSLEIDNISVKNNREFAAQQVIAACNKQGQLSWYLDLDTSQMEMGGATVISPGSNNSVYCFISAFNYLKIAGIRQQDFAGRRPHYLHFDSIGNLINVKEVDITPGKPFQFGSRVVGLQYALELIYMLDSNLNVVHTDTGHFGLLSAVMDDELNSYHYYGGTREDFNLKGDTLIKWDPSVNNWRILCKYNKQRELQWVKVLKNNVFSQLNDNKLLRINRDGELFVALRYRQDVVIDGDTLPFMDTASSGAQQTKAAILRFDTNGKLLSMHYDRQTQQTNQEINQTIWLEVDGNKDVYGYLFSTYAIEQFDEVKFDGWKGANTILWWNDEQQVFDASFSTAYGRLEPSLSKTRHAFWHTDIENAEYFVGEPLERKWNHDFVIVVFDTAKTKTIGIGDKVYSRADVTIYPNPTTGAFSIENQENDEVEVTIYAIDGKTIQEKLVVQGRQRKQLHLTASGVYLIHCKTDGDKYAVQRIIVN